MPRAGAQSLALGRDPEAEWVTSGGPRHAHVEGFDLHANVAVRGEDRERREQLCRYPLRPAVAQDRLRLTEDGRIMLQLKRPWQEGTSHLVFEPLDLLARLAALTPRPRINLIISTTPGTMALFELRAWLGHRTPQGLRALA